MSGATHGVVELCTRSPPASRRTIHGGDVVRRPARIERRVRCLRIAMLSLALIGAATGCSRSAAQSTGSTGDHLHPTSRGSTGGSPVSRSLHYPTSVTGYGGPLLSLPDTGSFDWLCTGPTGSTRRFHIRYTATTNEQVAVVEMREPLLHYRPNQPGSVITPPAQPAGSQTWRIRSGGENGWTTVDVRFQFAVIGGACFVQRTTASRTFASSAK